MTLGKARDLAIVIMLLAIVIELGVLVARPMPPAGTTFQSSALTAEQEQTLNRIEADLSAICNRQQVEPRLFPAPAECP